MESNLNEKDCSTYWTEFSKEQSSRLWLPTETVLQDSVSKPLNIDLKEAVEKSWFSTHWYTIQTNKLPSIFSPSFISSLTANTESKSTIIKAKRIRLYPTKTQKQIFLNWFGASRFSYKLLRLVY
jgi:putative transposase